MKIKNYTTTISATRTINEIEELLLSVGITDILKKSRGDGRIESITFKYQNKWYMIPSIPEKCESLIFKKHSQKTEEQAEKITWRVIKDWLHSQISLIQIGQVEVEQIMLPYMFDGKKSLYEKFKQRNFMLDSGESK